MGSVIATTEKKSSFHFLANKNIPEHH